MAIKAQCPDCGKVVSAPRSYHRKKTKCPNCGAKFVVLTAEERQELQEKTAGKIQEPVREETHEQEERQEEVTASEPQQAEVEPTPLQGEEIEPTGKQELAPPGGKPKARLSSGNKGFSVLIALFVLVIGMLFYVCVELRSVKSKTEQTRLIVIDINYRVGMIQDLDIDEMDLNIKLLQIKLERLESGVFRIVGDMESTLSAIERDVSSTESAVTAMEFSISSIQSDISSLQSTLDDLESSVRDVESDVDDILTKLRR